MCGVYMRRVYVQSVSITAALLPSLQAAYKMEGVSGSGVTGQKAQFTVELPTHSLSFATRAPGGEGGSVALPAVHVAARAQDPVPAPAPPGAVLRAGRYLAATADIGLFEHTLSTDLLNHLVFVQKVFMKVSVRYKAQRKRSLVYAFLSLCSYVITYFTPKFSSI